MQCHGRMALTRDLEQPQPPGEPGAGARRPSKLPKMLGGYAVTATVGHGGMGEVFVGHHALLNRAVAVKRMTPPPTADDDTRALWRERFVREGRALAKLSHENIVAVHDLIEQRGDLLLVLEYVDGFSVAQLLAGGALPVDVSVMVAVATLRALEVAHRAGILHRDVKPANVMIAKDGVVKLMDFGIAKDAAHTQLTDTGQSIGTPSYMAPETLHGGTADARSDVYAVGALLYEMLTGQRLFGHATVDNIWTLVQAGQFPRVGKLAPELPSPLQLLVERALKTDPKRRPASASALRQALEEFLASHNAPCDAAARLTAWLCAVGKIGEAQALSTINLDSHDAALLVEVVKLAPRFHPWRVMTLASTLMVALLMAYVVRTTPVADWLLDVLLR